MIKRLKCLLKGHNYMLTYNSKRNYYTVSSHDKCANCKKQRDKLI